MPTVFSGGKMSIHRLFILQIFFLILGSSILVLAGSRSPEIASADFQKSSCQNLFPRLPSVEELATISPENQPRYYVLPSVERPQGVEWKQISLRLRRQMAYQKYASEKPVNDEGGQAHNLDYESSLRHLEQHSKFLFFKWATYLESQEHPYNMSGTHEEFWVKYFNRHQYPELLHESDNEEYQERSFHIFIEDQKELLTMLENFIDKKFLFYSRDVDYFTALAFSSLMRLGAGLKQPEDVEFLERLIFVATESNDRGYFDIQTYLSMSHTHLSVQSYSEKVILSYLIMKESIEAVMMLKLEAHENDMEEQKYPQNTLVYLDTYLLQKIHSWMLGHGKYIPLQNPESFNQSFLFAMDMIEKTEFQDPIFQKKYGIRTWDDFLKLHMIDPQLFPTHPKLSKSKPKKKDTIH